MKGQRSWCVLAVGVLIGGIMITTPSVQAGQGLLEGHTAGDKLVRGAANLFLGVLEVPRNIHNVTQAENSVLQGWTIGLGKGVGYTVLRMVVGAYEIVTFPFPIPEEYRPVIEPEFVWEAQGPDIVS
ncbi:MAG: exosortase system-associated protein, TIGR04073 family [Candidatus Omnitrophota bacterium]|nr:exosortase system-associated protein, TIGR04073 family [Candidatus Omnitrophota bacterium]